MNANHIIPERMATTARHLVRRFPLATRVLELLLVVGLYVGGLVAVDRLSGHAGWLITVYAIFALPLVLSIGLRLYRSVERRLGHHGHDDVPNAG